MELAAVAVPGTDVAGHQASGIGCAGERLRTERCPVKKYFHLVSAARKNLGNPIERSAYQETCRKYPEEIQKLKEEGDWRHGFNSGALAILRLLKPHTLRDDWTGEEEHVWTKQDEVQQAEEEFPMLDT